MNDDAIEGKPQTEKVRAADVRPYEWARWCSIGGLGPLANEIVSVAPHSDGVHLWFMLDTYNCMKVRPDDVLDLIPLLPLADEVARV